MLPPLLCTQAMHYSVNVQLAYHLCFDYIYNIHWSSYYAALVGCIYTANIVTLTQLAPLSCFDLLVLMLAILVLCY